MADTTTTASSVSATVKTDEAKIVTTVQSDISSLKTSLASLEAKTFHFNSVALYVGIAFVVGVLTRFL